MINYLKGKVADVQKGSGIRVTLILEVNQVGYELQILPRLTQNLQQGEEIKVFTHQQIREDQMLLYGFGTSAERDLFRQLVSVSGIGTQLAIALLNTLELPDLVQAIVGANTRVLAKTPGVGPKTAERIALELKNKLAEWRHDAGLTTSVPVGVLPAIQEEVEMTLLALGYTGQEVIQALQAVSQDAKMSKNTNAEDWIREAISWLSRFTQL
ncbi:MAG: Holliday junction branch migration protein RuvA [Okeania sp. SIO2G4]|uniref:Holliday junction branch migration protein RuvA n=1 Tax=unclassified Okeania TaxID=2634635 RepID=UPI0013BC4E7D|nr:MULTISPECIES: Holliday junction branch migration protein RuvA [unclassified Okeania]NEP06347.1 Holliday junction branch migration protein RuvA [Okeania sp. SIO4D6]NEP72298.1 Holliday junction branch migration protein RuvA [Okeania sp. SIO2G5]NEP94265.1 Holliday junction branch migration protein RuvA [Okeania sp. SIO2F5]NEQ90978.1 Holliday junction branch migration protein RuvA [Okeania sp. SIO2G4]